MVIDSRGLYAEITEYLARNGWLIVISVFVFYYFRRKIKELAHYVQYNFLGGKKREAELDKDRERVRKLQIEALERQQQASLRSTSIYFTDEVSESNIDGSSHSRSDSKLTADIENRGKINKPYTGNSSSNSNPNPNQRDVKRPNNSDDSKPSPKPSFNHLLGLNGGGRYIPSSSMRDRGRRG